MEYISKYIGSGILALAIIGSLIFLFFNASDSNGNTGMLHIMGYQFSQADASNQVDYNTDSTFLKVKSESQKADPSVSYDNNKILYQGIESDLKDYIDVLDYKKDSLSFKISSIKDVKQNDLISQCNGTKIIFPSSGIYTIAFNYVDDTNRIHLAKITLPVRRKV